MTLLLCPASLFTVSETTFRRAAWASLMPHPAMVSRFLSNQLFVEPHTRVELLCEANYPQKWGEDHCNSGNLDLSASG